MALAWSLDKIGPICRSADDCGIVLHEIAGGDLDDPGSAGKGFAYVPRFDRRVSDFTVGFAPSDWERAAPEAQPALNAALEVVRKLGVKLVEVEIPDFPYGALVETIIGAEAASIFEDKIRSGEISQMADQSQAATLREALEIPSIDYLKAQRIRSLARQALREVFYGGVDMLLAPARMTPAPPVTGSLRANRAVGASASASRGLDGIIPAGNLAGLPAISLPCGFAGGLPVAISFVGRPFFDNHVIGLGRVFQEATDFHKQHPKV
jgi:aspartyl-tRNA(Asn)/glutamyl-tRNA(Gln) amidotransferase subunit A